MLKEKTGQFILKFARDTIEKFVEGGTVSLPENYPSELDELRGVFVTLEKYPSGELRGCIGLPYPSNPLIKALKEAACSAANDPRFPKLKKEELGGITVEVSVLTEPVEINFSSPEELLKKIEPGKDGLILKKGWNTGLFLPQVWEKIPDKVEFLENLVYKAGLYGKDSWKESKLFSFQVQAFREKSPG